RGVVIGHGYGGRLQPDLSLPIPRAAVLFPCMRGQSRSRLPEIPELAAGHVLHGIESRETYVHGGCAADVWCAASALLELVPEAIPKSSKSCAILMLRPPRAVSRFPFWSPPHCLTLPFRRPVSSRSTTPYPA